MGTYRLNRIFDEVTGDNNVPLLADSVNSINRLGFYHGVPVWFHNMNAVCGSEVDTSGTVVDSSPAVCSG